MQEIEHSPRRRNKPVCLGHANHSGGAGHLQPKLDRQGSAGAIIQQNETTPSMGECDTDTGRLAFVQIKGTAAPTED